MSEELESWHPSMCDVTSDPRVIYAEKFKLSQWEASRKMLIVQEKPGVAVAIWIGHDEWASMICPHRGKSNNSRDVASVVKATGKPALDDR